MIRTAALLSLAVLGACAQSPTPAPAHDHAAHGHSGAAAPAESPSAQPYRTVKPSSSYPLKTCVVSGDKLGSMGDVTAIEYQGQEIQFCCEGCVDEFLKSPDEFVSKVRCADRR